MHTFDWIILGVFRSGWHNCVVRLAHRGVSDAEPYIRRPLIVHVVPGKLCVYGSTNDFEFRHWEFVERCQAKVGGHIWYFRAMKLPTSSCPIHEKMVNNEFGINKLPG